MKRKKRELIKENKEKSTLIKYLAAILLIFILIVISLLSIITNDVLAKEIEVDYGNNLKELFLVVEKVDKKVRKDFEKEDNKKQNKQKEQNKKNKIVKKDNSNNNSIIRKKPQKKAIKSVSGISSFVHGGRYDWMRAAGISPSNFSYVSSIISRESGWNYRAYNPSGAYGLCQALPGSKMASAGSDWRTNPVTQLRWCNSYANSNYGSWRSAYNFWNLHNWW